jgi:hypothetical protein
VGDGFRRRAIHEDRQTSETRQAKGAHAVPCVTASVEPPAAPGTPDLARLSVGTIARDTGSGSSARWVNDKATWASDEKSFLVAIEPDPGAYTPPLRMDTCCDPLFCRGRLNLFA